MTPFDNPLKGATEIFDFITAVLLLVIAFKVFRTWLRLARIASQYEQLEAFKALLKAVTDLWQTDRSLIIVTLLSLLSFIISLVLWQVGQSALGVVSGALGLAFAAGKLFTGGLIAGAGGYVAGNILKRREKKASITGPQQDK